MATKTSKLSSDKFAGIIFGRVACDTGFKYASLNTGLSITDKVGLLINKIEYYFDVLATVIAPGFDCTFGLTATNTIATVQDYADPAKIDWARFSSTAVATPANDRGYILHQPITHDFSKMPGGGVIVAPSSLFLCAHNGGTSNYLSCRLYFTILDLSAEDYWQLVEARRIIV